MARTAPIRTFLFLLLLAFATLAGAQRIVSTIAGVDSRGDGLPATQAALKGPWGVAKDAAGNVFIADFDGHAVRRVDGASGIITTYAGTGISGNGGDGGPATQAELTSPGFLALAPNGDLYISDFAAHRVRKVDAATGVITHVAGNANGTAGGATFGLTSPLGIALNAAGDLFIADSHNDRIQKVSGGVVTTVPSFRNLSQPRGIAVDGADLLVVTSQSQSEFPVILRLKPDGTSPIEVGSLVGGTNGNGPALSIRLNSPFAIALAPNGDLYFTELNFNTLRRVRNGQVDTRVPTQSSIYGVAIDGADVLVSSFALDRVHRFNFDTLPQAAVVIAGGGTFTGDGGAAALAALQDPARAVQDPQGNIYVADTTAHRIRRIDATTGVITTIAGTGVAGFSGDGGDPLAAQLDSPMGLAFDANGALYVADSGNDRVRFISPTDSNIVTYAGGGASTADNIVASQLSLPFPVDVGFDAAGNLYVLSDSGKIHRINEGSRLSFHIAGTGVAGSAPDGTAALDAQFRNPRGLAVAPGGELYIADTGGSRVRSIVNGVLGTAGNIPPGTFTGAQGVALDTFGVLYVADTGNHRILRLDPAGNAAVFGTTAGFSGDGGPAQSARFNAPRGVSVTSDRRLLVADTGNGRVRAISAATPQAIDFPAIGAHNRTDPPFAVSATGGGSGAAVVFSSLTASICTTGGANGSTVTLTGTAGTCTIAANQAGNAAFDPAPQVTRSFPSSASTFTVTPSQSTPNGTITPSTPQVVPDGGQLDFSVVPDADYNRLVSGTCGGSFLADGTTFRTNAVHSNCTVIAFFGLKTFLVTASMTGNGTLTPSGTQGIAIHGQVTYTVMPDAGHALTMGGTCGGTLTGNSYTTNPVEADCTVTATFTPVPFTVTPSAGPGGNISPNTPQTVLQGLTRNFTITPGSAFVIDTVGGTCGGTLNGNVYTTAPVTADCTVAATFKDKITIFTVTNTAASGAGSLAQTLQTLKDTCPSGLKRVEFNIPAATDPGCSPASGICVVQTPDTMVGVRCDNTTVDGYTQPGASPNTRTDRGNDAQIRIEFSGNVGSRQTFALRGNDQGSFNAPAIRNVSVHGIAFPRTTVGGFGGNQGSVMNFGGNFVISGNWFGFHADGTPATTGVPGAAVFLVGSRIDGNRVGGPDPADRNQITHRNVATCCEIIPTAITANGVEASTFEGNLINVGMDGNPIVTNGYGGGFDLSSSLSQGTQSTRNNIVRRNVALNLLGTPISNNGTGNTFSENELTSTNPNQRMISGGNNQAVPVFGTVTYGAAVVASGTLQSAANEDFRIELFANAQVGSGGFGAAERFVGAVTVTSNASGLATWSVNLPADARNMTATATRLSTGDTSELSAQHVSQLTVTPSATGNGTITPSVPQSILVGGQVTFAVQPAPGHVFTIGGTCGGNVAGNSFTTNPVQASCTVTATFTPVLFTVTPSAGAGGTISPSTPQSVVQGQAQVFTITPGAAFEIDNVGGTCGGNLAGTTFTTAPIVADCTVAVTFKDRVTTYTVTTTAVSGPGSLAGILDTMNASCGGRNHIRFNIPAATDPGCNPATGICLVATPDLMRIQCFDTDLDGYTQPGASPNTRTDLGNNAQLRIELVPPANVQGQLELRGQPWAFGFLDVRRITVRGIAFPNSILYGYGFNSGSNFGGGGDYTLSGNWFGFHADGTPISAGPNPGIRLFGGNISGNVIGGPLPGDRNRFTYRPAGLCCDAIIMQGVSSSLFEGNFVNVDADGNAMDTRGVNGGFNDAFVPSNGNVLRRNVVMNVGGATIFLTGAGNTFSENVLVTTGARPITLFGFNHGQVPPAFGNVTYAAGAVNASGTLQSAANESFVIEVFSNATARPGGFGNAERFVGAVTVNTDATGLASWTIALPADARNMTATATRLSTGDTSELSAQHVSPNLFTVTPSAGPNGSITPATPQFAAQGATLAFTLAPATGFAVDVVGGTCGGALAGLTFTTNAVNADCTVQASFKAVAVQPVANAFPDFNDDGKADLLLRKADGRVAVWLMDGGTALSSTDILGPGSGFTPMQLADMNGDGKTDIVWQHTDGRVVIWLMNGATLVSGATIMGPGTGWVVEHSADFNGDGLADILWRHANGSYAVWLMNGTTTIGGGTILAGGAGWTATKTADFDGDGKDDILWTHTDGRVSIWLMNGGAVVGGGGILGAGSGWSVLHVPDTDGDGKADIVWQHTDGRVALWLMNGATLVGGGGIFGAGTGWTVARTGDFNGDGKADLLWQHPDGRATIWLMNGMTATAQVQVLAAGGGWTPRRTGDLNGDGKDDIVWQNADGRVAVWLMNGTTVAGGGQVLGPGTGFVVSPISQ